MSGAAAALLRRTRNDASDLADYLVNLNGGK
jgi:hypothetical protein